MSLFPKNFGNVQIGDILYGCEYDCINVWADILVKGYVWPAPPMASEKNII